MPEKILEDIRERLRKYGLEEYVVRSIVYDIENYVSLRVALTKDTVVQ